MGIELIENVFAQLASGLLTACLSTCAPAPPEPAVTPLVPVSPSPPPLAPTAPGLRLLTPNVTYELAQYICITPEPDTNPDHENLNRPRLVNLPASTPGGFHGDSPVLATPNRFRRQVVGWVFVETASSGTPDTQATHWLLLHEIRPGSAVDIEIKAAAYMGGNYTAPITVSGFTTRAGQIFSAAKLSSPDPIRDGTRYVKSVNATDQQNDTSTHWFPNVSFTPLDYPTPMGNGLWDGGQNWQIDGGSVGIMKKTATGTESPLVGWISENNGGSSGTSTSLVKAGYTPPSGSSAIVVIHKDYVTQDMRLALGAVSGTNRVWNEVIDSATYYQNDFPNDP